MKFVCLSDDVHISSDMYNTYFAHNRMAHILTDQLNLPVSYPSPLFFSLCLVSFSHSRCSADEEADALLDFNAVQRGDAEMENRLNRVIRACIEMGENNPIVSIHDQV